MSWLELPREIQLGIDSVTVKRIPGLDSLGHFDERTGEIALCDGQHPPGELLVLIHEALHVAETALQQAGIIENKMPEAFIENAAPIVALILTGLDIVEKVTTQDIYDFMAMINNEMDSQ